ncbi:BolA/IbaG family iron-sulfur metabolism protein [Pelagibacterales bacterium SAG-MED31]|nr:BolA/IbaG family iron-sulfur metabolism protein [Pelagibacterales bacterium SAG-MED31]
MNRTKRIKNILEKHFNDISIEVTDNSSLHKGHNNFDGTGQSHIFIQLTKNTSLKLNRLEVHRKINFLLSKEFEKGLHSLEIKIM